MKFEEAMKHCHVKPNGTYDLIPYVNAHKREVVFKWGNSLRLRLDTETKDLESIVGKVFSDVHPNRIAELLGLENVRVKP